MSGRPAKVLGVLGGMGPAATLDFLAKLQSATPATRDQEHLRVLVDLNPQVPDRNRAFAGEGPSPGPAMADMARGLQAQGAQVLTIACNTAFLWEAEVAAAVDLPLLSPIRAAAAEAGASGARRVGVLATDTLLRAGLCQAALTAAGLEPVTPDTAGRAAFMALLYRIKAGDLGEVSRGEMRRLAEALAAAGAEVIIAACTEVPLVLGAADCPVPLIDATEALARACVAACISSPPP